MKDAYNQPYGPSIIKKWIWILVVIIFLIVMVIPSVIVAIGGAGFARLIGFIPASKQYQAPPSVINNPKHSTQLPLEIGWMSGSGATIQQLADYKNLKVVSPEAASIDNQYNLQVNSDPTISSSIRQQGKNIWARVTMQKDTKPNVHTFLANPNQTQNVINKLVQSASALHWDGVNLDIENVNIQDRDAFSAFVKNLSSALNKSSIIFSIDLPPDSGGDNKNSPFDHEALGKYCNYIFFMGYDQHWSTDPVPGPVTSLSWLKDNVQEYIQTGVSPDKLILGLPAYTRIWKQNQQDRIISDPAEPIAYIEHLVTQNQRNLTWDSTLGEYYTTYTANKLQYKIWLPTVKSFNLYLNLVPQYHLAGTAVWSLDQMDAAYWNKIFQ